MVEGRKDDNGKARWDLMPMELLDDIANVLGNGAKRYGENNWQTVENGHERYFAALMRHITRYRLGQQIDPESGYSHLAHAACNLLFLDWFDRQGKEQNEITTVVQYGHYEADTEL